MHQHTWFCESDLKFLSRKEDLKKKNEFQTDKRIKKKSNSNHRNVKYVSIHYRSIPIFVPILSLSFYSLNWELNWEYMIPFTITHIVFVCIENSTSVAEILLTCITSLPSFHVHPAKPYLLVTEFWPGQCRQNRWTLLSRLALLNLSYHPPQSL